MPEQIPTLRWLRQVERKQGRLRLGVLSGTFNPPTRAHLAMAERAAKQLRLDQVLFVLPEIPPHKVQLEASLEDRAGMLTTAIAGHPEFSAAITSHGLFLDICRALEPHYPVGTQVIFLAGKDAAERILLHWPYADTAAALAEMFARFEIAVAERGGRFQVPADSLAARYVEKIHSLQMPAEWQELSATRARERVSRGEPVADLVPEGVAAVIARRGLYRKSLEPQTDAERQR